MQPPTLSSLKLYSPSYSKGLHALRYAVKAQNKKKYELLFESVLKLWSKPQIESKWSIFMQSPRLNQEHVSVRQQGRTECRK